MNFMLQGSPYNSDGVDADEISIKKQQRKKTLKHRPANNSSERTISNNAKNMIGSIHGALADDDLDLADFNPPPHSELLSKRSNIVNKGIEIANMGELSPINPNYHVTQLNEGEEMVGPVPVDNSVEGFNNIQGANKHGYIGSTNSLGVNTYTGPSNYVGPFKEKIPYYTQMSQVGNKDQLLEKLNYMIHLLETQQDEKTGHVMEELILYSFLGVFIIFIVDSFARAGKYTR